MNANFSRTAEVFPCAIVTGASSGIGAELARQLAPLCGDLILIARREDRLQNLADSITSWSPGCNVITVACDLSDPESLLSLLAKLEAEEFAPDLLVNNAGLGDHGVIADADLDRINDMIDVNIRALTLLTRAVLPGMIRRGRGIVAQISSVASLIPVPLIGIYAATKAYVTSFSEALRIELAGTGVTSVAICPGPISTEFAAVAKRDASDAPIDAPPLLRVPLERAVSEMIGAIRARRARFIPGMGPRLVFAAVTAMPMALTRLVLGLGYRSRRH